MNCTVMAHLVPWLAFERFASMDAFNRSYMGIKERDTDAAPVQFFSAPGYNKTWELYKTMGIHHEDANINGSVCEAYNLIVNFRRKARSMKLPLRPMTGGGSVTLAEAFWPMSQMGHIVPDFDDAALDGEIQMSWSNPRAPVSGIGLVGSPAHTTGSASMRSRAFPSGESITQWLTTSDNITIETVNAAATAVPQIYAELEAAGVKLSLANIELAKKTAAMAKLREQYQGIDDEWVVDLLMSGIQVPEEALKQPILLDRKVAKFGYTERKAMDGANLDVSRTTGRCVVDLNIRTPEVVTGGIIMLTLEIVPDQLFERQQDVFLSAVHADDLPDWRTDFLDPQKVEVVPNSYVDVRHATPTGTFGYAPLNHAWKRSITRVGGKFFRPEPDSFVEDRQRFWSVEKLNPTLTTDFYLVDNLPHSVFADTLADPFEIVTLGQLEIVGLTQFGKELEEKDDDVAQVLDGVDTARIVSP